jgi:hypothetical protein
MSRKMKRQEREGARKEEELAQRKAREDGRASDVKVEGVARPKGPMFM